MMKTIKQIVLTSAVLLFSTVVSGQIQWGGKAGIGAATQSELGNIYNNNELSLGYNAGLIIKYPVNHWFAVKTDLLYSQKGMSSDRNESPSQTDKYSYLIIPVKAELSAPLNKQKIFLATGPYAGFLLNAVRETDNISTDIRKQTEDMDFGISVEIGTIKSLSKYDLQLSLGYDMGLSEINKDNKNIRNKALTFSVGLLF